MQVGCDPQGCGSKPGVVGPDVVMASKEGVSSAVYQGGGHPGHAGDVDRRRGCRYMDSVLL